MPRNSSTHAANACSGNPHDFGSGPNGNPHDAEFGNPGNGNPHDPNDHEHRGEDSGFCPGAK